MNRHRRFGLVAGIAVLTAACVPLIAVAGNATTFAGATCPVSSIAPTMDVSWTGRDPKAIEFGGTLAASITSVVQENKANVVHLGFVAAPTGIQTLTVSFYGKLGGTSVSSGTIVCAIT
jgi:hypothetical protein